MGHFAYIDDDGKEYGFGSLEVELEDGTSTKLSGDEFAITIDDMGDGYFEYVGLLPPSVYVICNRDYEIEDSRYFTEKWRVSNVVNGLNAKREAEGKEPKYYYCELYDIRKDEK